ncbi:hypothetical protein BP5796_04448 [Coleophoma crateriformis]|uniref:alpha-amylase n=1 Tax=Coleophoma crateriformis TaxID=565419 RepID=A0A3D8S9C7_9HELO|nr:hypothetical protein BP5796_04448 [Coleophoma crateriformis]
MLLSAKLPFALATLTSVAQAASNDVWAAQSIYQIITDRFARTDGSTTASCNITNYCGGTWAGITEKLDYIQNMGFTAIQISPVNENLKETTIYGEAFHGYWVQNWYALNDNFGTAADLKNLSSELHKRNMYLLVDVVASEASFSLGDTTANMSDSVTIPYSDFYPFNQAEYFHSYCPITDWNNVTEYQDCWLGYTGVATPDLKTEDSTVATMLGTWVKELVSNYSIDGIRVDGAKQIDYNFFAPFVAEAGVYAMAEVEDGDSTFTCKYQNLTGGLENYPVYYQILAAFTAGEMSALVAMIGAVREACESPQYMANFIENQDQERFASYTDDMALAKNALAFTILADGIPKMYYGQEQHMTGNYSPYNRQEFWTSGYDTTVPLYNLTATLNKLRNHAISLSSDYVTNSSSVLYTDGSTYAARKGVEGSQIVAVLSNQGTTGGSYTLNVPGVATSGTSMTEVIGCTTATAGTNGTITVQMGAGLPKVWFPTNSLKGSGLCGTQASSTTTSTASGTSSSSTATSTKKSAAGRLAVAHALAGLALVAVFSVVVL